MNAITRPDGVTAADKRAAAPNESTRYAQQDTVLSPRFYTTDFEAMSRVDVSGVRAEWDALIAELRADHNKNHFVQTEVFKQDFSSMPPALRKEFLEFLVSSVTAEFSGMRAVRRDQEAHSGRRHPRPVRLHGARRGPPCGFHQRDAEGFRYRASI